MPKPSSASATPRPAPSSPHAVALIPTRIRLFLSAGVWMYEVLEPAASVDAMRELFGSAIVPTVFLEAMPAGDVAARIRSLNPQTAVIVDHDAGRTIYPPTVDRRVVFTGLPALLEFLGGARLELGAGRYDRWSSLTFGNEVTGFAVEVLGADGRAVVDLLEPVVAVSGRQGEEYARKAFPSLAVFLWDYFTVARPDLHGAPAPDALARVRSLAEGVAR
jgi:hypothetical protein